jgi:hypothetical protein
MIRGPVLSLRELQVASASTESQELGHQRVLVPVAPRQQGTVLRQRRREKNERAPSIAAMFGAGEAVRSTDRSHGTQGYKLTRTAQGIGKARAPRRPHRTRCGCSDRAAATDFQELRFRDSYPRNRLMRASDPGLTRTSEANHRAIRTGETFDCRDLSRESDLS